MALNTALYNSKNDALSLSDHDPLGQFAYITATLERARVLEERVIIIYHIPPGYDDITCSMNQKFHDRFVHAFDGYHDLIVSHFAGHTHKDLIRFLGDVQLYDTTKASVVFVAPSVDPRNTGADISKSNKNHALVFSEQYRARVSYDLADLSIESMLDFWHELPEVAYESLLNQYLSHVVSENSLKTEVCSHVEFCRRLTICTMGYSEIRDIDWCMMEIK
ncbi:hypothetical protein Pelo_5159 [Pelomyxa schiedti]|nr:hypothetical protein Pelo_5159 [Pelomyxa schiedti]